MFAGVIPILATPFTEDEWLDLESWRRLIEFMVDSASPASRFSVYGESNRLTDRERETLIESAVTTVKKRVPVIVGASHAGTRAAGELARMAQGFGADAVMIAPGKEAVPNDDRIFETYQRIADGLDIPIVLQDHPASTEVHMSVSLMLRLVREISAIQCIKEEAVPTAPKIRQLRGDATVRRLPILTGLGALYAPFDLEAGSDGFNTGFAFPEVLLAMTAAARAGDWPRVHRSVCAVRGVDCVRAAARRGGAEGDTAPPRIVRLGAREASRRIDCQTTQVAQLDALLALYAAGRRHHATDRVPPPARGRAVAAN